MPTQTTNYQCPACTAPLYFDSKSGKLQCDYCGNSYEVSQIESQMAQKQEKAADAFQKQEQKRQNEQQPVQNTPQNAKNTGMAPGTDRQADNGYTNSNFGTNSSAAVGVAGVGAAAATATAQRQAQAQDPNSLWRTNNLSTDWGADAAHMREYNCESCGAQIICDETTAATSCIYCGNPTVVPGQFAGALKPDYIIPFKVSREDAKAALANFCKGKFLLPKFFAQENHIEEIKGVYVPFWLFDGDVGAHLTYKASDAKSVTSGDYRITTTRHYNVERAGNITFSDIPVDASSKMPDKYMESIEPFMYEDLKPFSTAYMPGFFADKFDVDVQTCSPRADERAVQTSVNILRNSVQGYTLCTETSRNIQLYRGNVHYALAPVWMLSTRYRGKNYIFAMNGQTGKFVGELPCDKKRYWGLFAGIVAAIAVPLYFLAPMFA